MLSFHHKHRLHFYFRMLKLAKHVTQYQQSAFLTASAATSQTANCSNTTTARSFATHQYSHQAQRDFAKKHAEMIKNMPKSPFPLRKSILSGMVEAEAMQQLEDDPDLVMPTEQLREQILNQVRKEASTSSDPLLSSKSKHFTSGFATTSSNPNENPEAESDPLKLHKSKTIYGDSNSSKVFNYTGDQVQPGDEHSATLNSQSSHMFAPKDFEKRREFSKIFDNPFEKEDNDPDLLEHYNATLLQQKQQQQQKTQITPSTTSHNRSSSNTSGSSRPDEYTDLASESDSKQQHQEQAEDRPDDEELFGPGNRAYNQSVQTDFTGKEAKTPLVEHMFAHWLNRGPMTVAVYMQLCLQHPKYGYYTNKTSTIHLAKTSSSSIDAKPSSESSSSSTTTTSTDAVVDLKQSSDFITNTEIHPIYSEMIAVWLIHQYEQLGSPDSFYLCELGPGNGTMLYHVLKSIQSISPNKMYRAIQIVIVETSNILRQKQAHKLNVMMINSKVSQELNRQKLNEQQQQKQSKDEKHKTEQDDLDEKNDMTGELPFVSKGFTRDLIPVAWYASIENMISDISSQLPDDGGFKFVPTATNANLSSAAANKKTNNKDETVSKSSPPVLLVAHEFFDCLPVHQFILSRRGWTERLIDRDFDDSSPFHFKYLVSPTSGSQTNSVAKYIPQSMKSLQFDPKKIQSVEVCPLAIEYLEQITQFIDKMSGCALIIDYGKYQDEDALYRRRAEALASGQTQNQINEKLEKNKVAFSLQAVKNHKYVSVFHSPGQSDLTHVVDFNQIERACRRIIQRENLTSTHVLPIITQHDFLRNINISARLTELAQKMTNPNEIKALVQVCERLIRTEEMGGQFKYMAISNKQIDNCIPFKHFIPQAKQINV